MNMFNMLGMIGALIGGYAYLPQINHLIKQKCSAGISIRAFSLWVVSSALLLVNAIYIGSVVFIALGVIQLLATSIIVIFSSKHRGQVCQMHAHGGRL